MVVAAAVIARQNLECIKVSRKTSLKSNFPAAQSSLGKAEVYSMDLPAKSKQPAQRQRRSAVRRRSALPVMIRYLGTEMPGRIHDISVKGAAIDTQGHFVGVEGTPIRIECLEFCFLEGRIRWLGSGRIGVEFDPSTNAVAKVQAYFRFYHKDPVVQKD